MPYLSLISHEDEREKTIRLRKIYVYGMFGNKCHDCGMSKRRGCGVRKQWNLHHLSYPYGYDPKWDWIHAANKVFYDDILPEILAVCILLCEPCHRKRHNLPPKNKRRIKCQKQCDK